MAWADGGRPGEEIHDLSRIDRAFCGLPPIELFDYHLRCSCLWNAGTHQDLSDHVPLVISIPGKQPACFHGYRSIPQWIPRDPLFPHAVTAALADVDWSDVPSVEVAQVIKEAMCIAAEDVEAKPVTRNSLLSDEQFYWGLRAFRASRRFDAMGVRQCVDAAPQLAHFFATSSSALVGADGFHAFMGQLARTTVTQAPQLWAQ